MDQINQKSTLNSMILKTFGSLISTEGRWEFPSPLSTEIRTKIRQIALFQITFVQMTNIIQKILVFVNSFNNYLGRTGKTFYRQTR